MAGEVKIKGLEGLLDALKALPPEIASKNGGPARMALAKVRPALTLTCTWLTPASLYSTGSSTVVMLTSSVLSTLRVA
jgi:hypothetical protein